MPRKKTTLPATPVSQPITDTFTPSPGPEYQPVNAETARTTPASSPSRSPMPMIPRSNRDSPGMSRSWKAIGCIVWSIAPRESAPYTSRAWRNRCVSWNQRTCPSSTTSRSRQTVRLHRARRKARIAHRKRTKRAGIRFWVVLVVLLVASVVLSVTIWHEIQHLFGL